jgi:hypothetical protein
MSGYCQDLNTSSYGSCVYCPTIGTTYEREQCSETFEEFDTSNTVTAYGWTSRNWTCFSDHSSNSWSDWSFCNKGSGALGDVACPAGLDASYTKEVKRNAFLFYCMTPPADTGGGDSCISVDSFISMKDSSLKRAGNIELGDKVLSYDIYNEEIIENEIVNVYKHSEDYYYEIILEGGYVIRSIWHPYLTSDMNWSVVGHYNFFGNYFKISPVESLAHGFSILDKYNLIPLIEGKEVMVLNSDYEIEPKKVLSIKKYNKPIDIVNFELKYNDFHAFIANDILSSGIDFAFKNFEKIINNNKSNE